MKKSKLLCVIIALMMVVPCVVGCASSTDESAETYKVEYMNGTTVLKTENVAKDSVLTEWTDPSVSGKTFTGWYATPSLAFDYDFTAKVTKDVQIFGGFAAYQADTRDFYLVGSGTSPCLIASNWGNGTNTQLPSEHTATENVYTVTVDLYSGDAFQIAINSSWHVKRGVGYVEDFGDFIKSGGSLGDTDSRGANIEIIKDGNYTITLNTFPAEDYYATTAGGYTEDAKESYKQNNFDRIEITRNGEIVDEKVEAFNVFYIKGEFITEWTDKQLSEFKMTKDGDIHTYERYLKANDQFLFTSRVVSDGVEGTAAGTVYIKGAQIVNSDGILEANQGGNIVALKSGTYTFTYDEEKDEISATCDEDGTLTIGDVYITGLDDDKWIVLNADQKFTQSGDTSLFELGTFTFDVDDQFKIQVVTVGATEVIWGDSGNTISASNAQYFGNGTDNINSSFEPADATGQWPNYNIKVVTAGTYRITYDAYNGLINFYEV